MGDTKSIPYTEFVGDKRSLGEKINISDDASRLRSGSSTHPHHSTNSDLVATSRSP